MDMTVAIAEEALVFDATREMRERAEQYRQRITRLEALIRAQIQAGCRCPDCQVWMDRARDELGMIKEH